MGKTWHFAHPEPESRPLVGQNWAFCPSGSRKPPSRWAKPGILPIRVANTIFRNLNDWLSPKIADSAEQTLSTRREPPHLVARKPALRGAGAHLGASGNGIWKGRRETESGKGFWKGLLERHVRLSERGRPDYFFRVDFCSCLRSWPYSRLLSLSASLALVRVSICRSLAFIWSSSCCRAASYCLSK